ncbi:unnamed protein product [Adineta ricciae]|nr:unnamed protein product [Adineta ricciae]
MNEAVVTDFVGDILKAMVAHSNRTIHHDELILSREKQIISKDEEYGGNMEFIVTHNIDDGKVRHVIVVEAKRDALGKGLTQLLLALKSMWETNNDQKTVYGFVTTATLWQLVTFDGQIWKLSESMIVLFGNMPNKEDRWLKSNTQLLDVIYTILSSL